MIRVSSLGESKAIKAGACALLFANFAAAFPLALPFTNRDTNIDFVAHAVGLPEKIAARRKAAGLWPKAFTAKSSSQIPQTPTPPAPPLPPAIGPAESWQPTLNVYSGQANLATGNLTLAHRIGEWQTLGPGVSFSLFFNSQSGSTGTLGAKWSHNYEWSISGTNPAVVRRGDGKATAFALSGSTYVSPAGHHETLVKNSNGTWTLTFEHGDVFQFNTSGKLVSLADANGNATTLTYSGSNLTSVQDQFSRTLSLSYSSGKVSSITDCEGRVWTLGYDGSGRLSSVTDPALGGQTYSTQFGYNSNSLVSSITNRLNKTWTYSYSSNGVFLTYTDPLNHTGGRMAASSVNPDTFQFSSNGSPNNTPDNQSATYPVDTVSTTYVEDVAGNPTEYGMNSQGRITARRDGNGDQTNYTYDADNNISSIVIPGGYTTTYSYDSRGNRTSEVDPTGRTTTHTYDARNNKLTTTDNAGKVSSNTYDIKNNTLTAADETNQVTTYTYNTNGTLATATDNGNKTTTYTYDFYGNCTGITNPNSQTEATTYTFDRVSSRTDARGRVTTYGYDGWGRRTSVDYPTSTDQTIAYDAEGRVTQTVDGTGTRTYTYDDLGRKTSQVDPRGTTNATYTNIGQVATQTDPAGRVIQYQYDANGQMTAVGDSSSSASYQYDDRARLVSLTYSNGTHETYTYDNAGRELTRTFRRTATNAVITSSTSTYDGVGRLQTVTESPTAATITFGYDDAGRILTEARTGANPYSSTYTYNNRGLRATVSRLDNGVQVHNGTYTYDNTGRLTTVADSVSGSNLAGTYTWNADSTLASYPGPGYRRKLDYDEEGRIVKISKDYGGSSVTLAYEYGYGIDGSRRWRKDYAANTWDWFPCGVACCAGELIQMRSTLSGGTWTVVSQNLKGLDFINRDGSFFNTDVFFRQRSKTSAAGVVNVSPILDAFGVKRTSGSYSYGEPVRSGATAGDEGVIEAPGGGAYLPELALNPAPVARDCAAEKAKCIDKFKKSYESCKNDCPTAVAIWVGLCLAACAPANKLCLQGCNLAGGLLYKGCMKGCEDHWGRNQKYCDDEYRKCLKTKGIIQKITLF